MNNSVSIVGSESYDPGQVRESLDKVLEPLGGMACIVRPGERILIKPNFVIKTSAATHACTHAEIILAVARAVREAGAVPMIADSPALGSAETVAKSIGLTDLAAREGFPIRTLNRVSAQTVKLRGETYCLPVSAEAIEADGIINLPKFKAHRQATLTFGVKNLYGCVVGKRKAARHFASGGDLEWFSRMLVANASILSPRLTLVDGVVAMEGQGPTRGTPRPLGVLVAGTNTFSVDSACCRIVDYPPLSLSVLKAARDLGVMGWDTSDYELVGESVDRFVIHDFRFPEMIPIFFSFPQLVRSCFRSWREKLAPGT